MIDRNSPYQAGDNLDHHDEYFTRENYLADWHREMREDPQYCYCELEGGREDNQDWDNAAPCTRCAGPDEQPYFEYDRLEVIYGGEDGWGDD